MMDTKQFMIVGLIIAVLIGVVAVFLASADPDGLESSALVVTGQKDLTGASPEDGDAEEGLESAVEYGAPLPDYSTGDESTLGAVFAVVVGVILMFIIGFGATKLIAKPET